MTADEILKALEESEGVYFEVEDWVIAVDGNAINPEEPWIASHYASMDTDRLESFASFKEALAWVLREVEK